MATNIGYPFGAWPRSGPRRLVEAGTESRHWLAERRHRPLQVALSPLPTALTLAIEAAGGPASGAPPEWLGRIRGALDGRDLAVLATLASAPPRDLPCCLVPAPAVPAATPSEDIARIIATEPEILVAQVGRSAGWALAARAPKQWLSAYGRALARTCDALRPLWASAHTLLDREIERVGAAVVQGFERELVAGLLDADRVWSVRDPMPATGGPRPEVLVAVPMLAGPHVTIACYRGGTLTQIAYPLPGVRQLCGDTAPAQLEAMVGTQRARILRRLDRPTAAGEIAELLQLVPGGATHHIALLERAGLVHRERRGRSILVRRTPRGKALLALYDGP